MTTSIQVQLKLRPPIIQPPKHTPPSVATTKTKSKKTESSTSNLLFNVAWTGTRTIGTFMGQSILWLGQSTFDLAKTTIEETIQRQASSKSTTLMTNLNNDDDILATLKMAEEAIALATNAVTTSTTTLSDTTLAAASATVATASTLSTNVIGPDIQPMSLIDDDDVLDIMATLLMANDAIALAESITTSDTNGKQQ